MFILQRQTSIIQESSNINIYKKKKVEKKSELNFKDLRRKNDWSLSGP